MTASILKADLFPGFAEFRSQAGTVETYARVGGSGPPLLLLHGYPQTHVCWHKVAPELARDFTLVIADLRGYGQSSAPPGDQQHSIYSKRAMATDCVALMRALGHERFMIAGHDRGGRVAYRLALDSPEAVTRLAVLGILPTLEVWERITAQSAIAYFPWTFHAQPHPFPETLIAANPKFYVERTLAAWTLDKSLSAFASDALEAYRAQMSAPERIHAMCEDYRAGATCDRKADADDRKAERKIECPTLALWGSSYAGKGGAAPLDVWRAWAPNATGQEIASGHFLMEEAPEATAAAMMEFFRDAT